MGDICTKDSSESNHHEACCFGLKAPFVRKKEGDPLSVDRAVREPQTTMAREAVLSGWPWMKPSGAKVILASDYLDDMDKNIDNTMDNNSNDNDTDDETEYADAYEDEPMATASDENNSDMNHKNHNNQGDNRLLIKDLLLEYRDLIDAVQRQLADKEPELYDPSKHDDLWILRFLLSHKKSIPKALAAAQTTLHFRHKYRLDDHDLRHLPPQTHHARAPPSLGFAEGLARFWAAGVGEDAIHVIVPNGTTGGVIAYLRVASLDTHALSTDATGDDWLAGLGYVNEWSYQWLDYITRTTGKLTKAIRTVDVEGIHWAMQNDVTRQKYTAATHEMQNVYPQAVQMIFVCRAPQWIQWPWWMLKPLMPARVVEKIDFINPQQSPEDLTLLLKYVPEEYLPERFGGKLTLWPPNIPPPEVL